MQTILIGINGNKKVCQKIKREIKDFIANKLHMELSEEKALITHSNECAIFLGYVTYDTFENNPDVQF